MFLPIIFILVSLCSSIQAVDQKPLRILMIVQRFPLFMETFVINEIKGLCDAGHELHLLVKYKDTRKMGHELEPYHLEDRVYYNQLPAHCRSFDIIYAQFSYLADMLLEVKRQGVSGKLVMNFCGGDMMLRVDTAEKKAVHKELIGCLDCSITVCDYIKQELVKLGYPCEKIHVLYSGIDCAKFIFKTRSIAPRETLQIVSVGRLAGQKGYEYALRALARVYKQHKNIHLTIAGGGPLHDELLQLIKELQLTNVVQLLGEQTHDQVARLLARGHLFLLPSTTDREGRFEGIPNAIKEAMACGLPILSTYHAGIPELVENGKSGFLVNERDVNALAERIMYLLEHPEQWAALGSAGRAMVEECHELSSGQRHLNLIFAEIAQS